ncbi:contractile injection system protein, VgrG/Pvc8 family [Gynuella sunshinyii]|nr:contractile injection system protein, VgrG/Pvc8 family [Gynuella sunshinyii]
MTFTEITLTLASGTQLPVQYMEGWEDLNQPTRLEINCPITELYEDTDALLGQAVTVSMQAGDHQRVWQLVIDRIQYHSDGAGEYWQFYLCSKLLWGRRLQRTRLFMDLNREQVLRQLLRECGYQDFEVELVYQYSASAHYVKERNITWTVALMSAPGSNKVWRVASKINHDRHNDIYRNHPHPRQRHPITGAIHGRLGRSEPANPTGN